METSATHERELEAPHQVIRYRDTRISDLINDKRYREMLLKRTGISYLRKKENLFMYVMKDIAHRGCINSPEYCSPQAFSARSFLDSTMSCDVTGILAENALLSPALYQTLRGQRIKRGRLGTRLPNIKDN